MKYLFAGVTIAALVAAMPAGAQTAYGATVSANTTNAGGNWRDAILIYAGGPDPILLDRLVAPLDGEGSAALPATDAGSVSFDPVISASASGLGGMPMDAVGVPEPATWAMMLIGFGAVGGALRSRRKTALRYA